MIASYSAREANQKLLELLWFHHTLATVSPEQLHIAYVMSSAGSML